MSIDCPWRVGIGYDVHRLVEGRRLVLGGIRIENSKGLLGHSDSDAVLHAIIDALLGAAGLQDIGELFPDKDPAYKDADSGELLTTVLQKVRMAGYQPVNIDCVVHAEEPRLSSHKRRMAERIAELVGLPPASVNVKATTNEGLGYVGAGDAIACTAVALVVRALPTTQVTK